MKKIAMLMMGIIFLLVGCTSNSDKSLNKNVKNVKIQAYSFGPMADLSKLDDKLKENLQDQLNNFGDIVKDEVTFNPIDITYNEDGSIVVDLFVRNGHSYDIFNIDTELQVILKDKIIADGFFKFTQSEFGKLSANTSRPWSVLFYPEDVKLKNVKTKKITIKSIGIQYEF